MQRHDRESGDLYGMLPLVRGMPVALTDHIDRSREKNLLRGRRGYIHSWVLESGEAKKSEFVQGRRVLQKHPKVVFVKLKKIVDGEEVDEDWTLDGLKEPGLYKIVPKTNNLYMDKGRKNPHLQITRRQIPLAPAFAMTSHAAQGQTLGGGAIVDLCAPGAHPMGAYVAMTRVKNRADLLIYRPFDLEPFQRGERKGPTLLLKHLRVDDIDWDALEQEYMPSKRCSECRSLLRKDQYLISPWNRPSEQGVYCKSCLEQKTRGHRMIASSAKCLNPPKHSRPKCYIIRQHISAHAKVVFREKNAKHVKFLKQILLWPLKLRYFRH